MENSNIRPILSGFHYISYLDIVEESAVRHAPMLCRHGMRPYDRFFFIDKGHITIRCIKGFKKNSPVYGETVKAGPGQIVYIPYDSEYYSTWLEMEQTHHIRVNFILHDKSDKICPVYRKICILEHISGAGYKNYFFEIAEVWNTAVPGYHIKAQSLFMNLLYHFLLNSVGTYLKHNFSVISKGVLYLENNFMEDFTADTLASMCNISPSWFRRLFAAYAGMSPLRYRNMLRVRKAAELLNGGEHNVTEAAAFVNCNDLPYFNRLFRQVFGTSPQAYLKALREGQASNTV